ncbi:tripartite tricarboxylate transporter permease [Candidatus Micrarchaeota archaeon]|nr:tripartite tricarboxylate transporter permease [Candidatus Micrarchaeota archaeon]
MDFLSVIIGIVVGVFTGLVPGLHVNTVSEILADLMSNGSLETATMLVTGIYTVLSFFPSIVLGVPDENLVVSMLPGQRLVKRGKGNVAIRTVVAYGVVAVVITLLTLPVAFAWYKKIYVVLRPFLIYILLGATVYMITVDREFNKILKSTMVFLAAGLLGTLTSVLPIKEPLFPMFVGMFALPMLILSGEQVEIKPSRSPVNVHLWLAVLGVGAGFVADLLPGIATGGQMAVFFAPFLSNDVLYLGFLTSLGISKVVFGIPMKTEVGKNRIGSFTKISITEPVVDILLLVCGIFIGLVILYTISKMKIKLTLSKLNTVIILYLVTIVALVSGLMGLILLTSACLLGLITLSLGVRRIHLMGSLIVPTVLYLTGVLW